MIQLRVRKRGLTQTAQFFSRCGNTMLKHTQSGHTSQHKANLFLSLACFLFWFFVSQCSHANRAIHLALVPLCRLAKNFKSSYLIKAKLDLVSHDDGNSIHKGCLICRVLLAIWEFSEAHIPHSLRQSLALCSFGERSGVESQGRLVCHLQVDID